MMIELMLIHRKRIIESSLPGVRIEDLLQKIDLGTSKTLRATDSTVKFCVGKRLGLA